MLFDRLCLFSDDSVISQVNNVRINWVWVSFLDSYLVVNFLLICLLFDQNILHLVNEGSIWLLFSNLKRKSLKFREITLSHIHHKLIRLYKCFQSSNCVWLFLTVLQLLVNYTFIYLFQQKYFVLQLILFFLRFLKVWVKLLVFLNQNIF